MVCHLRRVLVCVGIVCLAGTRGWAQASDSAIAVAGRAVGSASTEQAQKALDAAKRTLAASKAARAASDTLRKLLADTTTAKEKLISGSEAAAKAARTAAATADTAFEAAAVAQDIVKTDLGKNNAGVAVAAAVKLARTAGVSATSAEKAAEAAKGSDGAKLRAVVDTVATQTRAAADATDLVSMHVADVAREAVQPSLPVTTDEDNNLLEALRVRITGGSIFFNGKAELVRLDDTTATLRSSQFAQASVYLALESQPRLFSGCIQWPFRGVFSPEKARWQWPLMNRCKGRKAQRTYDRIYLDPNLALRLTTIPVVGASTDNPEAANTAASSTPVQSQKAVQVAFGAAVTVHFGGFRVAGTEFHWGVGPAYKRLYQSVTDAERVTRVWNINDDLFDSRGFGLRLVLYQRKQTAREGAQDGWAPAAYLDWITGKFQSFENASGKTQEGKDCLKKPAKCIATGIPAPVDSHFDVTSDRRNLYEGRVFLQFIYLGFDLNTGSGRDDLRFIGGMTIQLDQFFRRR